MWIYQLDDEEKWVVGFFDPKKEFHEESKHDDQAAAASRVHYLNGGTLPYRPSGAKGESIPANEPVPIQFREEGEQAAYDGAAARARRKMALGR